MKLIRDPGELAPRAARVCLAIGFFDGVHLGHQQVIRQCIEDAKAHDGSSVVITFDQHPATVVAPSRVPPLIYPLSKKLRVIGSLESDAIYLIHFDKAFSQIPAEQFIRDLARDFGHVQSVCVGRTFTFGHKHAGNVALLQKLGSELSFAVHGLANVSLGGEAVSSTRLRKTIASGDLDLASQMLGRPYKLCGPVVKGDQLGRQLGFPTANIDYTGLVLPPTGVYAVRATVEGATYRGVLNIGHRPTLKSPVPRLQVEAHLLEFDQDIYGKELEVTIVSKLREERVFPSLDALRAQITEDVRRARACFTLGI